MRIRLVTYSTKPRGGVVHALSLAEALGGRGHDVELWALSADGAAFFRPPRVPARLVPVDRRPGEDVEARILRYAEALADGLGAAGPADVHLAQDCLSAGSLLALRAEGRIPAVVRTVHHVDDFASEVLRECQRASIEDVDHRICVSRHWADALAREHGVGADVIPNGVDAARFAGCRLGRAEAGARLGWGARPAILAIGGIEPRKGSRTLLEAFDRARGALGPGALLAVAGGETLFDYAEYRAAWEDDAARLGLRVHRGPGPPASADVAVLGPVADAEMPTLYRAADVFAFLSDQLNAPRWQRGLHEVRRTTDGPIGVGSEHVFVRRVVTSRGSRTGARRDELSCKGGHRAVRRGPASGACHRGGDRGRTPAGGGWH